MTDEKRAAGDRELWLQFYAAALAGSVASQRGQPNPKAIVRSSAAIADAALEEMQRRAGKKVPGTVI
jgi:hypothetical protein